MPEPLKAEMPVLMEILGGADRAALFLVRRNSTVFSPLGNGPATAADVAKHTSLPSAWRRARTQCVCRARFCHQRRRALPELPLGGYVSCQGKPGYVGNMISQTADRYAAWGKMPEAVRSDKPVLPLTGAELV